MEKGKQRRGKEEKEIERREKRKRKNTEELDPATTHRMTRGGIPALLNFCNFSQNDREEKKKTLDFRNRTQNDMAAVCSQIRIRLPCDESQSRVDNNSKNKSKKIKYCHLSKNILLKKGCL